MTEFDEREHVMKSVEFVQVDMAREGGIFGEVGTGHLDGTQVLQQDTWGEGVTGEGEGRE